MGTGTHRDWKIRKAVASIVMLFIAVAFLGGCLPRYAQVDDTEVNAALRDVLQQYQKRSELARSLIMLVRPLADPDDTLDAEVAAAQADLDRMLATPQARTDQIEFGRFEIAQRQLGDAISRLLIESGNDRHLSQDPRFRSLRRQLAAVDRRIAMKQKTYDEATDRYNASLTVFPHNVEARLLALHPRPKFGAVDKTAKRPPRTDFGALGGSTHV
jgi:LemA protein